MAAAGASLPVQSANSSGFVTVCTCISSTATSGWPAFASANDVLNRLSSTSSPVPLTTDYSIVPGTSGSAAKTVTLTDYPSAAAPGSRSERSACISPGPPPGVAPPSLVRSDPNWASCEFAQHRHRLGHTDYACPCEDVGPTGSAPVDGHIQDVTPTSWSTTPGTGDGSRGRCRLIRTTNFGKAMGVDLTSTTDSPHAVQFDNTGTADHLRRFVSCPHRRPHISQP